MSKITIEIATEKAKQLGYILLNEEVTSNKDRLFLLCPNGHEHSLSYGNFFTNKRMCAKCKKEQNQLANFDSLNSLLELHDYKMVALRRPVSAKDKCEVVCNNSHLWNASLSEFKSGIRCGACANNVKFTQRQIEDIYENEGYQVISTYINAQSKIKAICPEGHEWEHLYTNFKGGNRCYECSGTKRRSLEDVRAVFEKKGFIPTFSTYQSNKQQLSFLCKKHLSVGEQYCSLHNLTRNLANCQVCYRDKFRGSNHANWSGGEDSISKSMRGILYSEWVFPSLEKYDFKCYISGDTGQLEVHHQNTPFNQIIEDSLLELDFSDKSTRKDFNLEEFHLLRNRVLEKHHEYGLGIPLRPDIHQLFHKTYGYKNNNFEQFLEFYNKYKTEEVA